MAGCSNKMQILSVYFETVCNIAKVTIPVYLVPTFNKRLKLSTPRRFIISRNNLSAIDYCKMFVSCTFDISVQRSYSNNKNIHFVGVVSKSDSVIEDFQLSMMHEI